MRRRDLIVLVTLVARWCLCHLLCGRNNHVRFPRSGSFTPAPWRLHVPGSKQLLMVSALPDFARAGGLMAYGPNLPETYRPLPLMVSKILGGATPSDLPVERPSKSELVVNVQTAKALGVAVPASILQRADEVIE